MSAPTARPLSVRNYFVDESGDATLFSAKGHVLIGIQHCSRYFILGLLDIPDSEGLARELEELRARLLADPYFKRVISMQPEEKKTAVAFHANDDIDEVRWQVFALLKRHDLRFFAVVRDKLAVLDYVLQRNERDNSYRYNPNELYDSLVRRLFKNLLHKDDAYNIYFAKRGKSDRTVALRQALEMARLKFSEQWGKTSIAPINVIPATPAQYAGLQAVDYFLWALQRLYERRQDRYVEYLWPAFRVVHDVDDSRQAKYGVYYTQKRPLTSAALPDLPGI